MTRNIGTMHDKDIEDKVKAGMPTEPENQIHPSELKEGLARLATPEPNRSFRIGARLRNYFFTGLVIVGPVTITIYIAWWFINYVDDWVKPFVPTAYNPDTYLPFALPGIGLFFAFFGLTVIGALAANLLGRTLISSGELMLGRMPIIRNVYSALKQIFESVVSASSPGSAFQKVGLIEFPRGGIWSIVFVTAEASGEIRDSEPGSNDLVTVFMPTAIVPPTGFVCFVPRREIIFLRMSVEDAAKVVISAGMVPPPEYQDQLKELADKSATPAGDLHKSRRKPTLADLPGVSGAPDLRK